METPHGPREGCPDLETIAAYVDGRLEAGARETVAAHLSTCEECYEVFTETVRFQGEVAATVVGGQKAAKRPWLRRARILTGVGVSLLAAGLVGVALLKGGLGLRGGRSAAFRELVRAVGTTRPIEPRLTGGFAWGEPRPVVRGSSAAKPSWQVLAAAGKLKSNAEGATSSNAARELADAELIVGETGDAITRFEEAARQEPKNASVLSDLSAAYLVRGSVEDRAQDIAKALDAAAAAVALDPNLTESLFNRALALDALSLSNEAKKAWEDYLKLDATSEWADEARRRLSAPTSSRIWKEERTRLRRAARDASSADVREIVARFPQESREYAEEELLDEWTAFSVGRRDAEVRVALGVFQAVALAHADVSGDPFLRDTYRTLESANCARDNQRCDGLRKGHRHYLDGRELYRRNEFERSSLEFYASASLLEAAGSPYAALPVFYLAVCEYQRGHLSEAESRFARLASLARSRRYVALLARIDWMTGLIRGAHNDFEACLRDYESARSAFSGIGELGNEAALNGLLSDAWSRLGDAREEWGHEVRALEGRFAITNAGRRHGILSQAASQALNENLPHAALSFISEAVEGEPDTRSLVAGQDLLVRARILRDLNRTDDALVAVRAVRALGEGDPDRNAAEYLNGEAAFREAELLLATDPTKSAVTLRGLISMATTREQDFRLMELHRVCSRALLAAGQTLEAQGELEVGIRVFEQHLVKQGSVRRDFVDITHGTFSDLVWLLAIDKSAPIEALAIAEQSRARDLLLAVSGAQRPLPIEAIQARLPAGIVLIYYAVLPADLLIWTLENKSVHFVREQVTAADLRNAVARYGALFTSDNPGTGVETLSGELFDLLIRPVQKYLPLNSTLALLPDDCLTSIPFAALRDTSTGRLLVEDYALALAPSGTFLSLPQGLRPRAPQTVLVVGPGRSAPGRNSSLPRLPAAEHEAAEIAALYPKALLLAGSDATPERLLAMAPSFDVLHVASHAITSPDDWRLSRILLDGGRVLFSSALTPHLLDNATVVVLAACDTAAGRSYRGEGVSSIARAFLAAGAGTVVASLGPLPDATARDIFTRFHAALLRGADPAQALRASQLEALRRAPTSLAVLTVEVFGLTQTIRKAG
jgi:CHAT domain-containing protein